jgi:hypothetical protein
MNLFCFPIRKSGLISLWRAFSQMQRRLVLLICSGILLFGGCGPEKGEPTPVFEGEKTLAEVLSILKSRTQSSRPMKANGQCLWQSYSEGEATKESFAMKIWANPPGEVYMQGDVAFNPRGIVLGSNAKDFWLLVSRSRAVTRGVCGPSRVLPAVLCLFPNHWMKPLVL